MTNVTLELTPAEQVMLARLSALGGLEIEAVMGPRSRWSPELRLAEATLAKKMLVIHRQIDPKGADDIAEALDKAFGRTLEAAIDA
jgi:hypothetical protein